ncbi:MAG: DEAD/DEAH box helicase [Saprospiraceae bacterium]|nr:DEAD/DEAH box helicase [Saprospiraceae bacterium]MBK7523544.1 DEAD/DEAH box helicase [Saprospiraceae bacterium]MBK9041740.1 DEAD/DEAH box helicase [Saprospiraceae bacterium]
MTSFEEMNLNKAMMNALKDLNITTPTLIQERSYPVIASGKDILGIAQTGTGKTFAYLIPLIKLWKFSKERHAQILIIVPTRELVAQVVDMSNKLSAYMNIITLGVHGGANLNTQAMELLQGADILVGTPGRILDLAYHGTLQMKHIKKLVIDEVDEMLDQGFRPQLKAILDLMKDKKQNIMFSATMTDDVLEIIEEFFQFPEFVEAAPTGTPLANIEQYYYEVYNFNTKVNLLSKLLLENKDMTKVVIFTASKAFADLVYKKLEPELGEKISVIHSNKSQNQRFAVVNDFQDNKLPFLVATDIIARGIDISQVSHVINFDIPDEPEDYLHRIGRTGRANKSGISISFVSEREKEHLEEIVNLMQIHPEKIDFPSDVTVNPDMIMEELPVIKMKNQLAKIPIILPTQSAFKGKTRNVPPPKKKELPKKKIRKK